MKYHNVFIILILLLSSCLSLKQTPYESDIPGTYHRVKKGETLNLIAKKYNVDTLEIMEINGITKFSEIKIGQLLYIPDVDPILKYIARNHSNKKNDNKTKEIKKNILLNFPLDHGKIIKRFSKDKKNPYDGIAIKASLNSPIKTALDGQVLFVGDDNTRFGLLVIIEHQKPFITVYTHLNEANVKTGQKVKKGQVIGKVGVSGGIKEPLLHWQVRVDERPQDPLNFVSLPKKIISH